VLSHGHYSIHNHGQLLIVRCIGSWTNYTARQMSQDLHRQIKQICNQPWAVIFSTVDWELGTPDIWLPLSKLIQWSAMHNQKKMAIVYKKRLQLIMLTRLLEPHKTIETEAFGDEESALTWLAEFQTGSAKDTNLGS